MADRYITEQCNLSFDFISQWMLTSAYQNIRLNSHSLKFFYTGLCRFCLHLFRCFQIRNQCYMNQNRVVMSHIMLELTNRLKKRLTFNITNSSTNLYNRNLFFILFLRSVEAALNLIGDVRDDLHSTSAKVSMTFFL